MTQPFEINYDSERQLLEHLLSQKERLRNKPELIIEEISQFGLEHRMKCVNQFKVKEVIEQVQKFKPEFVVQFGTHGGYSSILVANELRKLNNGAKSTVKVFTFEVDPVFQQISSEVIELSGLQDSIVTVFCKSGSTIQKLAAKHLVERIDLLLLDHWKNCYLPDLRLLETLGLITKGSVILADNISQGETSDYLEYVRSSPSFKRLYNTKIRNVNGAMYLGKWGLVYESQTVFNTKNKDSNQGIELTHCVGLLDG